MDFASFRRLIRPFVPQFLLDLHRQRWERRQERHVLYIIDEFHRIYYPGKVHEAHWLGVPAIKCPLDCWVYAEIIFNTRPEVIVETGVRYGGTTLYLASLCELLGHGQVIGVDLELHHAYDPVRQHPCIHLIQGNSVDPVILEQVWMWSRGKRTMVILDSDHHGAHVLEELRSYSEMVTSGCYMICEDTNLNGNPVFSPEPYDPGPKEAVEMFLKEQGDRWEVDTGCEKFLLTMNPGGYLKKK
jgi:cephalosporin hydroxylase